MYFYTFTQTHQNNLFSGMRYSVYEWYFYSIAHEKKIYFGTWCWTVNNAVKNISLIEMANVNNIMK